MHSEGERKHSFLHDQNNIMCNERSRFWTLSANKMYLYISIYTDLKEIRFLPLGLNKAWRKPAISMMQFSINDSDWSGQHSVLGTTRMHMSAQTLPRYCIKRVWFQD